MASLLILFCKNESKHNCTPVAMYVLLIIYMLYHIVLQCLMSLLERYDISTVLWTLYCIRIQYCLYQPAETASAMLASDAVILHYINVIYPRINHALLRLWLHQCMAALNTLCCSCSICFCSCSTGIKMRKYDQIDKCNNLWQFRYCNNGLAYRDNSVQLFKTTNPSNRACHQSHQNDHMGHPKNDEEIIHSNKKKFFSS